MFQNFSKQAFIPVYVAFQKAFLLKNITFFPYYKNSDMLNNIYFEGFTVSSTGCREILCSESGRILVWTSDNPACFVVQSKASAIVKSKFIYYRGHRDIT